MGQKKKTTTQKLKFLSFENLWLPVDWMAFLRLQEQIKHYCWGAAWEHWDSANTVNLGGETYSSGVLSVHFNGLVGLGCDQFGLTDVEHAGEDARLAVQRSRLHGCVDALEVVAGPPVPHVDGSVVGCGESEPQCGVLSVPVPSLSPLVSQP